MCQIVTYRRVLMLLLLLVSVSALVSCSFGKGQMSEEFIIVEVSGALKDADLELHNYLLNNRAKLKELGWNYEYGQLSRAMQVPVSLVQSENNESIKKKDERSFFVSLGAERLSLQVNGEIFVLDINDFFNSMDCCPDSEHTCETKRMSESSEVARCNDFNGPLGNGQNDQGGVQGVLNFIGSDCDRAMAKGLCWDEHSNNMGGCYNTHGGKLCADLL